MNIRIALAFENLTPIQVCQAAERAIERPCHYVYDPKIEVNVSVPNGYRQQLAGLEILFGKYNAPYFPGPDFAYTSKRKGSNDTIGPRNNPASISKSQDPRSAKGKPGKLTDEARGLWEGYRGLEEYFREVSHALNYVHASQMISDII